MPPPPQQKRGIAHFFKPFAQEPASTIPQKRSSPCSDENDDDDDDTIVVYTKPTRLNKSAPKTPSKVTPYKNVTPSQQSAAAQPIFSPLSQQASLPIRSPQPTKASTKPLSPVRQRTLFETRSPPTKSRTTDPVSSVSFNFSDAPERGQGVIKDGILVAVRDSDEDDTDSLESLADLFARKKKNNGDDETDSSPPEDADLMEAERVKTLSMFTNGRSVPIVGKEKLRALYAKERALKFDVSRILDDHFGDEEDEEIIRKARENSDDGDRTDQLLADDKRLLADIVKSTNQEADQDDVSRLLSAVERTEALDGEKSYTFFESQYEADEMEEYIDMEGFPGHAIPHKLWQSGDANGCARAFMSGMMTEIAARGQLDDAAIRWTFQQITKQHQEDLRHSYIRTVQAASKHWTRSNVSAANIQKIFEMQGANPDAIRDNSSIKSRYQPRSAQGSPDLHFLLPTLDLLMVICKDMDMLALSKLCSILLRITMDMNVMSRGQLSQAVETLFSTLLDLPDPELVAHVHDRLVSDATTHLHEPVLQAKLLSHISPISPRAIQLRKTLADIFLMGSSVLDASTNTSNASLEQLTRHISTSPSFSLTRQSGSQPFDYTALTSLTSILDIAIGAGNPPTSSTDTASSPSKQAIRTFNTSVDDLADKIQSLFVSIKDTGASHMRRTEAKDALQALYFRLLYSVRIGVRKKKHIFDLQGGLKTGNGGREGRWVGRDGDEVREERRGGQFMAKFLAKARGELNDDAEVNE